MTTKPDPATMTGDEILAEIRAALPAIREIPTSPSDPGWPGPVASNLASLNELVAELVGALADRGISDPEFADMVRRIFRDHSHRLGFEFRGEPFFGDGGDLLDRMVEEILAVSSPTGGTDYEEQKWKRAVRGIAARIFRAGMASGWDKHRAAGVPEPRRREPEPDEPERDPGEWAVRLFIPMPSEGTAENYARRLAADWRECPEVDVAVIPPSRVREALDTLAASNPFGVPDLDCRTCSGTGRVAGAPDVRCPDCPGDPDAGEYGGTLGEARYRAPADWRAEP